MNEEKKGVKIVGARSLEQYVSALKQMLPGEEIQPKEKQSLKTLFQKEKLLFSREIEELYTIEPTDIGAFISEQLADADYEIKEVLGEKYITTLS